MRRGLPSLALAAAMLLAQPAAAQPAPGVPDQSWYPEGYRDLRIAAAEQAATFPREPAALVTRDYGDPRRLIYNLAACDPELDLTRDQLVALGAPAMLALEVARLRAEFARLGYAAEVYDGPLLDYERDLLASFAAGWAGRAAADESWTSREPINNRHDVLPDEDYGYVEPEDPSRVALANALEAQRIRLQPDKPRFVVESRCGGGLVSKFAGEVLVNFGEEAFTIDLVPANGELWLVNAFAFRVCERKVPDPWNHRACSWSQYRTGDTALASGRYMYEVRWGNTVERGARTFVAKRDENLGGVITFSRKP